MNFPLLCLAIVVDIVLALWSGFVLKVLWGWFIVTSLGVKEISWFSAVGIIILSTVVLNNIKVGPYESAQDYMVDSVVTNLKITLLALALGSIVHYVNVM